jgi:hypothetical protein
VWRCEFQQLDKEYIQKAEAIPQWRWHSAEFVTATGSKVGVASAQHGRESRHFHLTALFLARLFEMPVVTNFLESAFAVDLLLETPQGLLDGFTLL